MPRVVLVSQLLQRLHTRTHAPARLAVGHVEVREEKRRSTSRLLLSSIHFSNCMDEVAACMAACTLAMAPSKKGPTGAPQQSVSARSLSTSYLHTHDVIGRGDNQLTSYHPVRRCCRGQAWEEELPVWAVGRPVSAEAHRASGEHRRAVHHHRMAAVHRAWAEHRACMD